MVKSIDDYLREIGAEIKNVKSDNNEIKIKLYEAIRIIQNTNFESNTNTKSQLKKIEGVLYNIIDQIE